MSYKIIKTEVDAELTKIVVSGDLVLTESNSIKNELLASMMANMNYVINFESVSNIDLSVLQVIESFKNFEIVLKFKLAAENSSPHSLTR